MRRLLVALTIIVVPVVPVFGAPNKSTTWTPELMMKVKDIIFVQVSPDGKKVAYTVREAVMEPAKSQYLTHVHVANIDGSDSFQLTQGEKSCEIPQWSPDGKHIAFLSSRSGKANVWLIRPSGGEAWQLTDVESSVGMFKWAPDGKSIAFTAVDPRTKEEENAAKEKNDAKVVDTHFKMNRLHVIPIANDENGKRPARRLTTGNYHVGGGLRPDLGIFDWSPDAKTIAFTHTPTPRVDEWTKSGLSVVDVVSGTVKSLVAQGTAANSPRYSPDGQTIAFVRGDNPPSWAFNFSICVMPAAGGEPRELAETFDRNPHLVGWSADGGKLYYTEARHTTMRLCALPLDGKPEILAEPAGVLGTVYLNATRTHAGFPLQTTDKPVEAHVSALEQFTPTPVSRVNQELALPAVGRTELQHWKSGDGREIEGLLTLPADYEKGKRCPLILIVHGGPAGVFSQNYLGVASVYGPLAVFSANGYAILRCNPRGSGGYGKEFRFANIKDWGGGDYRDIMAGVDHVIGLGIADPDRLAVMGLSYGGFMTSWIITQTQRFKAASVGAGVTNLMSFTGTADIPSFLPFYFGGEFWDDLDAYRKHSAMFNVKAVKTPTLILHGDKDERVPLSQGQELYNALKRQGCVTEMVVYPRTPHAPTEPKLLLDVMKRDLAWFDKHVKGDGAETQNSPKSKTPKKATKADTPGAKEGTTRPPEVSTVPPFRMTPAGVLEWPNKLRLSHGGGENSGLPPQQGLVRAQPGGNIVLQPQGDYMRSAIDLLPTRGKQADLDAIGEFTIHRIHPTATTQEMISYSALARKQDVYAVVVEAHGEGKLKPLVFMNVQGGLRNPSKAFSAEAMRMTEDGTMVFGLHRQGGRLKRPIDSLTLDQPTPTQRGLYDSDYLKWVGKSHDGKAIHRASWRAHVHVERETASKFVVQNGVDDAAPTSKLEVSDQGDMELPTAGGAVILRSPSGKRWRVTVTDAGELRVKAAD